MRLFKSLTILLSIIVCDIANSQNILKIYKVYALIDIDQTSGLKVGDIVSVYRKSELGQNKYIGRIKIVKFQDEKCAGKITHENNENKVSVGDFIEMISDDALLRDLFETTTYNYGKKSNTFLTFLYITTGAAVSYFGYRYFKRADETYAEYEVAKTTDDAMRLYDKTVNYDKYSNVSFWVGGGLVVWGLLRIISNQGTKSSDNSNNISFSIMPVQRRGYMGLEATLFLDNPQRKKR